MLEGGRRREEDDEGGGGNADTDSDNENGPESAISFLDYLKKFCSIAVIQQYARLLDHFEYNQPKINHCIIKLFYRICHDLKQPGLFYQISILRIFQKIIKVAKYKSELKEAAAFAIYFLKKFFVSLNVHLGNYKNEIKEREENEKEGMDVSNQNPNFMFPVDLLFWKNSAAMIYDIETGEKTGGSSSKSKSKLSHTGKHSTNVVWSEHDNDVLRRIFSEVEMDPDSDWVHKIMEKMYNSTSAANFDDSSDSDDENMAQTNHQENQISGDYNKKQISIYKKL